MVRDLWWKGFNEEVSFEFRVKERRSDGWRKWRREGKIGRQVAGLLLDIP